MDTRDLRVVEYSDERVLTTEQLAFAYECSTENIKRNFGNNKERFEEGKHYFKVEGDALNELRGKNIHLQISPMTRTLYLWTKRGALRHCKMLGTDKAWDVFDELEENYFSQLKTKSTTPAQIKPTEMVLEVGTTRDAIQKVFGGVMEGIATAQAVSDFYKANLLPLKQLLLPAEHETGYMNATQLGEKVGKSARTTNKWLADNGYQFRDGRDWRLTDKGKRYAEEIPYNTGRHSGYQIKWTSQIVTFLLEDSIQ